jgi:hypothetical protein
MPNWRTTTLSQMQAAGSWAPRDLMPEHRMPEIDQKQKNLIDIIARSAASLQRLTKARDMIRDLDQEIPTKDWIKQLRELLADDHKAHPQETTAHAP